MVKKLFILFFVVVLLGLVVLLPTNCSYDAVSDAVNNPDTSLIITIIESLNPKPEPPDTINIINGTFLGNTQNNYYGNRAPSKLDVIWKMNLGYGKSAGINREWYGAGWTGQPLIVKEKEKKFIIQGAYDHHLKKIDAENGNLIWQYEFDDILKGTGTIWVNSDADSIDERYVILQGSRRGEHKNLSAKQVTSFRAVSYISGRELWKLNSIKTQSSSRDVDASAIIINDTAYISLENGIFTVFDPDCRNATIREELLQPAKIQELNLYNQKDISKHGRNIVTESTPCILKDRMYITSGSGHVYGYNLKNREIDWDFYVGADLDGSPVVTRDSCILITLEKQFIQGRGGVFKLDPSKTADSSVVWFFPTKNKSFAEWNGGIIGSVAVNDKYVSDSATALSSFIGIDGYLYIVDHETVTNKYEFGPNKKHKYPTPKLIYKKKIGASISTPVFVQNKVIAAGYGGIFIFEHDKNLNFHQLEYKEGLFEATPVVDDGRIYVASRDGNLYCFGNIKEEARDSTEVLLAENEKTNNATSEHFDSTISSESSITESLQESEEKTDITEQEIRKEPSQATLFLKEGLIACLLKKPVSAVAIVEKTDVEQTAIANEVKSHGIDVNKKFQVIAGSFKTMARANDWSAELVEMGFENVIIGPVDGYYHNTVSAHDSYNDAISKVLEIREGGTDQVWVMKHD